VTSIQPLLQQVSRMLGAEAVAAALGPESATLSTLTVAQADALEALIRENHGRFTAALVAEAADSDDVGSADSALAYARLRLSDFAALLSDRLRLEIELEFQEMTADWG
jgi:hypothetical protein